MLSSPIILYDYPQVAPESPGDFFDGTEIDEMLTLRILTLTDEEKRAMAAVDDRAGDAAGADRGAGPRAVARAARHGPRPPAAAGGGRRMDSWDPEADRRRAGVRPRRRRARSAQGDRVRLRPRGRADILDLALAGKTATVEAIEQDFEGRVYLAVTVDDDPGKDLGAAPPARPPLLLQPEEVEPFVR